MQFHHMVCMLALSAVAVGCGGSRSRAVDVARKVGVSKLRADLQTVVASPSGQEHQVPRRAWPESVKRFRPLAVELHMKGVLIVLK